MYSWNVCTSSAEFRLVLLQFVPFRNFIGGRYGSNMSLSQAYLAKEVLAEIPDQVTEFMKKNGTKPRPPPDVTPASSTAAMWWPLFRLALSMCQWSVLLWLWPPVNCKGVDHRLEMFPPCYLNWREQHMLCPPPPTSGREEIGFSI